METRAAKGRRPNPVMAGLLLVAVLGCAPPTLRLAEPRELESGPLSFLVDGRTTREEALLHLGTPNAHFEGERILTWTFVGYDGAPRVRAGRHPQASEKRGLYFGQNLQNLVLVFGEGGVLARHSLVVAR